MLNKQEKNRTDTRRLISYHYRYELRPQLLDALNLVICGRRDGISER